MSSGFGTKRRSKSWDYFEVVDETKFSAKCKICSELFSYRTSTTNLMKHVRSAHKYVFQETSESDAKDTSKSEDEKAAKALEEINGKDNEESLCLLCQTSFASQDTNEVMEHMTSVHNITTIKMQDGNIQFEQELSNLVHSKGMGTAWDHFTVKDSASYLAQCNLCEAECSYESAESLMAHLADHHRVAVHADTEDANRDTRKRKRYSLAWDYFTVKDANLRLATCNTCDTVCSYKTNVHNLIKHIERHKLDGDGQDKSHKPSKSRKRNIIMKDHSIKDRRGTKNSKLDPLFIKAEKDEEDEALEMHEEYLESDDDYEPEKLKDHYQPTKRTKRRRSSERPRSHLYHFANYVTSLLEQLPDNVSKKLQMDFVKQILEAQISCDRSNGKSDLDGQNESNGKISGDNSIK